MPGARREPVAAFDYSGSARDLILGLKVRARRDCAGPLVDGLVDAIGRSGLEADVVTWVPGRPRDIRMRGFDHAEALALGLSRRLGLTPLPLVRRAGPSEDQSGLRRMARLVNVHGAFLAMGCPQPVALVDDLITTGATAGACVAALTEAGIRRVEVLAAAAV